MSATSTDSTEKPRITRRKRLFHPGYEWVCTADGDEGIEVEGHGPTPEAAKRDWEFWNRWSGVCF